MEKWWRVTWALWLALTLAAFPVGRLLAQDELIIEEEAVSSSAGAASGGDAGAKITSVTVVPVGNRIEVRVQGTGELSAKMMVLKGPKKLVVDFPGATYGARRYALGSPGLGDVLVVRGAQFQPPPDAIARVVVELKNMVSYEESKSAGKYVLSLATKAEAEEAPEVEPAPTVRKVVVSPAPSPESTGGLRSRVLHAMVTDLPDRVRLVVTADGILRYKLSSLREGGQLQLNLYDVDLKWTPPRLSLAEGPIQEVRAQQISKPSHQVEIGIKLRSPRPYYVRRDQNQVIVEVEKAAGAEAVAEIETGGGNLTHKVTLNVQDEDLRSLIKALAFEAGFENVILNKSVTSQRVTLSLREVSFAKAMNLILSPNNLVWKVERGIMRVGTDQEFTQEIEVTAISGGSTSGGGGGGDGGIVTQVFTLKYISVLQLGDLGGQSQVKQIVTDLLVTKNAGKVYADPRTNSLVVTDASSNMPRIAAVLKDLDVPVPQVMIEARLVSMRRGMTNDFGVTWSAQNQRPANPEVDATFRTPVVQASQLKTGFLGPGVNIDLALSLLETKGDAKVLLNPRISTLHDQQAFIGAIDTVSYMEVQDYTDSWGNIRTYGRPAQIRVPVQLTVQPHVNPDRSVALKIEIISTAITGDAPAAGLAPPRSEQVARTQLIVKSEETAVIGGMLRDSVQETVNKVPILGSLPWFLGGSLFRSKKTNVEKTELVLFLTPIIGEDI